jgi:hypothetical protein
MGQVLIDNENNPEVVVLGLPKLKLYIPSGTTDHPTTWDFITRLPKLSSLIITSGDWEMLFKKIHAGKYFGMQRYAFTSEELDINFLSKLASNIPSGYELKQMDFELTQKLVAEKGSFTSGHLLNFDSIDNFISRGFGFCILERGEIVSAATTFVTSSRGVEIQISTRKKHRRKGLATAAAAQLLIHSLQNGLDPNWDAENDQSIRLAKKLGYTPQGCYKLWLYTGSKQMTGLIKVGLRIKEIIEK